jgi:two-component system, OmpR family, phosphate regulon sensor histidine kinase PhoR
MVTEDRARLNPNSQLIKAYEAALVIAREVTPEAVLQRTVDLARDVVPARYAALGITAGRGSISQIITSGASRETPTVDGLRSAGHELLEELIRERVPRLISEPAAVQSSNGASPPQPSVWTQIGVPVLLGDQVLGGLYLTDRMNGEPFDENDLVVLRVLATHAAAAIDRADAYRRAEEQRDQLRAILDCLPAGFLMLSATEGPVELANSAAVEMIFGTASLPGVLPVYGRDMCLLSADGTPLADEQSPVIRAFQGEDVQNQQLMLETANGKQLPVLAQSAPLPAASGMCDRVMLVLQDITRLREAEQIKDDFLSLISHELRTPLTAIHGGAHLLAGQGETLDEQTRKELLDDIVVESDRLDRMMRNMLTLTAIMAGRVTPSTEPVLVGPLARETADELAPYIPDHTIRVEIPQDLPPAEGDPALLAQVLRNLYENAAKYSPDGGEIVTTASSNGRFVTIEVTDNGIGIAENQVGLVFERFRRVGGDPTVRGMGLGLYLSRHLVEAQGGQIVASSPGIGSGATIAVTLPIAHGWTAAGNEPAARSSVR